MRFSCGFSSFSNKQLRVAEPPACVRNTAAWPQQQTSLESPVDTTQSLMTSSPFGHGLAPLRCNDMEARRRTRTPTPHPHFPELISAGRLKVYMWATSVRTNRLICCGSFHTSGVCMLQEQDKDSAPQQINAAESATKEGSIPTAEAWDSIPVPLHRTPFSGFRCCTFFLLKTTEMRRKARFNSQFKARVAICRLKGGTSHFHGNCADTLATGFGVLSARVNHGTRSRITSGSVGARGGENKTISV